MAYIIFLVMIPYILFVSSLTNSLVFIGSNFIKFCDSFHSARKLLQLLKANKQF